MDGDKVASIATATGATGLALSFTTIGLGLLAIGLVGGIGYVVYRTGKATCKKISELHDKEASDTLTPDGPG